jgi:glutaconate CoA-transferase subunit B
MSSGTTADTAGSTTPGTTAGAAVESVDGDCPAPVASRAAYERLAEPGTYSAREMMAIAAGRFIRNGDILFAGTGVAMLAACVAKRIHAPRATVFFETGGIDPGLSELPMAVADPRVMDETSVNSGLIDSFSIVSHRKLHTIAFLGAAQIDRYGNMNSTCIGDYHRPTVRFSGSGGACDAGSLASAFIVFMQHGRRKFVEKLDYLTTPGWLSGGDARARAGFARGGPLAVVTDLCVLKFAEPGKEMYLDQYFPGVTVEHIVENTGFEIDVSHAEEAQPPSEAELEILRRDVDPQRLILG